jgi:DNA-binding GntR family transcriptional regulator
VLAAPLRQRVANNLRDAIIEGKFKPGERLKENELCAWTGVSRTAVREALRQLEAEGVVANIPNRGPAVACVSPEEAQQYFEVRGLLEALMAKTLAQRITDAECKTLQKYKSDLDRAFTSGRIPGILETKERFEAFLASASQNSVAKDFRNVIHARLSYLRPMVLKLPHRLEENRVEIGAIIDAILAKKPDAAWRAAIAHVTNGARATLKVLAQTSAAAEPESAAPSDKKAARRRAASR